MIPNVAKGARFTPHLHADPMMADKLGHVLGLAVAYLEMERAAFVPGLADAYREPLRSAERTLHAAVAALGGAVYIPPDIRIGAETVIAAGAVIGRYVTFRGDLSRYARDAANTVTAAAAAPRTWHRGLWIEPDLLAQIRGRP